ncbi:MAG: hypothetical protein AAF938_08960 [Myxococcota bacterium]
MLRSIFLFLSTALVWCHHGIAFAQSADESRARAHFAEGQAHAEAGEYEEAHAAFASGFALSERPLFLFNMAEASFLGGDQDAARGEYERYLRIDPDGVRADAARLRLSELGVEVEAPAQAAPARSNWAPAPDVRPETVAAAQPVESEPRDGESESVPLRRNWKFWTALAAGVAVVTAGVAIGVAASSGGGTQCGTNCWDLR